MSKFIGILAEIMTIMGFLMTQSIVVGGYEEMMEGENSLIANAGNILMYAGWFIILISVTVLLLQKRRKRTR